MTDKVWIIGTNPDTRTCVNWDEKADYWVFNEVAGLAEKETVMDYGPYWCKRVTASFQMHAPVFWRAKTNINDAEHYQWLRTHHGYPIYMQEVYPDVPESVKYPLEEITRELLPGFRRTDEKVIQFFTSTPAFAIALAIYQGYKTIQLAGVEMGRGSKTKSSDSEYMRQAEGIAFWIGIAIGKGITVILPKEGYLYRDRMYGYSGEIMIMREEFEINLEHRKEELAKLQSVSLSLGTKSSTLLDALMKTQSQEEAERLLPEFFEALKKSKDADFMYGVMAGRVMDDTEYLKECDEKIAAAGGEKAVKEFLSYGVMANDKAG